MVCRAIPVDDQRRVLEDLPRRFEHHREQQPKTQRPSKAPTDRPEQQVESEAVNDVGKGVPVGEMLRILGAEDNAVPRLDVAALADWHAPHRQQNHAGEEEHRERRGQVSSRQPHARHCGTCDVRRATCDVRTCQRATCGRADVRTCERLRASRRPDGRGRRRLSPRPRTVACRCCHS